MVFKDLGLLLDQFFCLARGHFPGLVDIGGYAFQVKGSNQVNQLGAVVGPEMEGSRGFVEDHSPGFYGHNKFGLGPGSASFEFFEALGAKHVPVETLRLPKAGIVLRDRPPQINLYRLRLPLTAFHSIYQNGG